MPNDFVKAAATLLAETAIQARRTRARELQKRADLSKYVTDGMNTLKGYAGQAGDYLAPKAKQFGEWASNKDNAHLVGALGGAAAGGLGGLALGAGGKRKKSPWTSALTGALAGGITGGAAGLVYKAYQAGSAPDPGGLAAALKLKQQEAHKHSPTPERVYNIMRGDEAAKGDTFEAAVGAGARRNIDPWTVAKGTGVGVLGAGLGALRDRGARVDNTKEQFTHGAAELLKPADKGGGKPAPAATTAPPPAWKGTYDSHGILNNNAPDRSIPAKPDASAWQRTELEGFNRRALTGNADDRPALMREIERARTGSSSWYQKAVGTPRMRPANEQVGAAFRLGQTAHPTLPRTTPLRHGARGVGAMIGALGLQRIPGLIGGWNEGQPIDLSGGQP